MAKQDDTRITVPLVMLDGNIDVLLNNTLPVEGISLRRYGPAGVVLTVHMSPEQKEHAKELGFRTTTITADGE
jgi:hypothetical protein